jgi:hypothetical protein
MQIIVVLIGLFFVASMFYGFAEGAKIVRRFVVWLFTPTFLRGSRAAKKPVPELPVKLMRRQSTAQSHLDELQELHNLYQNGALSREEFEQFKQSLLSSIAGTAVQP